MGLAQNITQISNIPAEGGLNLYWLPC